MPKTAKQFLISRGQKTGTLIFRKVSLETLFYATSKGVCRICWKPRNKETLPTSSCCYPSLRQKSKDGMPAAGSATMQLLTFRRTSSRWKFLLVVSSHCLLCLAYLQAHPEYLLYILRRQIRKAMQHVISARLSRHSFKVPVVYP